MTSFLRLCRLAAGLFLLAPFACAAQVFGLPEILGLIERRNPDLLAVQQQRPLAAADVLTARAYPNPEVEFGTGPWRSRIGGSPGTSTAFGVSQPIELPSVRAARLAGAEAGTEAAEATIQAARLAVGFAGRMAFYDILRRQDEERLAQENAELLADIRGRVAKRVEVGEAPRFELVRADAEALAAQNARAAARLRLDEARAALQRLTRNALPDGFRVEGRLPEAVGLEPFDALQQATLASHPSLRALEAERERARRRLEEERALRSPAPTLRAQQSTDPEMRQFVVGISIPLPLWNRREGPIARAAATIDLVAAQAEAQRSQLLRELDSAYARAEIAQRQIETFESGLLRSAQAALQSAEAAYRAGERSFIEVLDAQRTLRTVRNDYAQALFDRQAARLDLKRLSGRDPFAPDWN